MSFIDDAIAILSISFPTYSEETLKGHIYSSSVFVVKDTGMSYVVNVSAQTIIPEPVEDNHLLTLVCLYATYQIYQGELGTSAASSGVSVRLGPASISTAGKNGDRQALVKRSMDGYHSALFDYLAGRSGNTVISPATGPGIP